jgi:hypothetical protein
MTFTYHPTQITQDLSHELGIDLGATAVKNAKDIASSALDPEYGAKFLQQVIDNNDVANFLILLDIGLRPFGKLPNRQNALRYADSRIESRAISSLWRSFLQRRSKKASRQAAIAKALTRIRPPRDER